MKTLLVILTLPMAACMTPRDRQDLAEWRYVKEILALPAGPPIHVETK